MSTENEQFKSASLAIKTLQERPDDNTMLKLYALYKQGSSGDVSGSKPGFFDFVGNAKYEAWEKLKGTEQASAQQEYIDLVKNLGANI